MYQEEAERVVGLCGGGVPCIPGAERPIEHREDMVPSSGLEFLVEEAWRGPLTISATGPATDVASLLLAAPKVRETLRVVWLGGFGDEESYRRYRAVELNGRADIAAWRALLEGTVDLLQVPGWPAPAKLVVRGGAYAGELRGLGRPVASYFADILELWVKEYVGPVDPEGEKILWDVACVAAVADPEAMRTEPLAVPTLDAAGAHNFVARGRTVEALVDLDEERVLGA